MGRRGRMGRILMTHEEAAIVSAYTGILIGPVHEFHKYAEKLLGHSIFTHDFLDRALFEVIKNKSKKDFISIKVDD